MRRSIALRLSSALCVLAALFASIASPAFAGDTPGTYSWWQFNGVTGLSDVAYTLTVEQHPGQASQIYWSNQVGWNNGRGGYAGMQTNADPNNNLFLFSVWDVTQAVAGSPGSWCQPFGGEGEGMSCRIYFQWTAGHAYRFHYAHEGDGWWGMTVTDLANGTSFKLGSILVGSTEMSPTSVSWVEYYRWSDSRSSCQTEPYSRARFELPVGNGGANTAVVHSTSVNICPPGFPNNGATVVVDGAGARHTLDIGNSVMGPITGLAGKCVDRSGTQVLLWSCHGGTNQAWLRSQDGAIRSQNFTCLDAGGSQVKSVTCNGSALQQWQVQGLHLYNPATNKCLSVKNANSANGTVLVMNTCKSSLLDANQRWTPPVVPPA